MLVNRLAQCQILKTKSNVTWCVFTERWKMMQLLHGGLTSPAYTLWGGEKLWLCKGHPSLCFIPSQELHGLVVGRRVALWGSVLGGYLPTTVLSTLLGDDILGVQDSSCAQLNRVNKALSPCVASQNTEAWHMMSVASQTYSVVNSRATGIMLEKDI